MSNRLFGIRLNPRQAFAWENLGNDAIRELIAPSGICVKCREREVEKGSRNGWYCWPCHDLLSQGELIPEKVNEALEKENAELRAEVKRLKAKYEKTKPTEQQQELFGGPSSPKQYL